MAWHVREKATARKLRLFAHACCQRALPWFSDGRTRAAVALLERSAEGQAEASEVEAARELMLSIEVGAAAGGPEQIAEWAIWASDERNDTGYHVSTVAALALGFARRQKAQQAHLRAKDACKIEARWQIRLLHDIFGNLFHAALLEPSWITPTVSCLARAAYLEIATSTNTLDGARLAVLSDALEEAGCTDEAILSHLRSPGPHVRGCWALDLVLGRE
jgi:hypothetical protein